MTKNMIIFLSTLFLFASCSIRYVEKKIDPWTKEKSIWSPPLGHGNFSMRLIQEKGENFIIFHLQSRDTQTIYRVVPEHSSVKVLMSDSTILNFYPAYSAETHFVTYRDYLLNDLKIHCSIDMNSLEKLRDYDVEMIRAEISPDGITEVSDKKLARFNNVKRIVGEFINEINKKEP